MNRLETYVDVVTWTTADDSIEAHLQALIASVPLDPAIEAGAEADPDGSLWRAARKQKPWDPYPEDEDA